MNGKDQQYWQDKFDSYNEKRFQNKIPRYRIIVKKLGKWRAGVCFISNHTIALNTVYPKNMRNTLLHEMVHAYLAAIGKPHGHTKKFWKTFAAKGGKIMDYNQHNYTMAARVYNERITAKKRRIARKNGF